MAIEKKWSKIPPVNFSSNGTVDGIVTVASTLGFKTKQTVFIVSSTQPGLSLEVKRVLSKTQLRVGPTGTNLTQTTDISTYLVADTATIEAAEQARPSIPDKEYERAVFEEEPTVAKRVVFVDPIGNFYDDSNPLPIAFDGTIDIGQVRISAEDDDPHAGDQHSSVRVSNGINDLGVNNDGSINVVIQSGGSGSGTVKSFFNETLAVPINATQTIVTYTVPVGKIAYLLSSEGSGTNIATYDIIINGSEFSRRRTYFSGPFNALFKLGDSAANAPKFVAGDIIQLKVTNFRPSAGDFEGRFQIIEV